LFGKRYLILEWHFGYQVFNGFFNALPWDMISVPSESRIFCWVLFGTGHSGTYLDEDFLFKGQRGVVTVSYLNRLVKDWCQAINLKGNYGSHTLRKTWGYHQRVTFNTDIPTLMTCFNHSTQRQTLEYLCIQPEDLMGLQIPTGILIKVWGWYLIGGRSTKVWGYSGADRIWNKKGLRNILASPLILMVRLG